MRQELRYAIRFTRRTRKLLPLSILLANIHVRRSLVTERAFGPAWETR